MPAPVVTTETRIDSDNLNGWSTIVITYADKVEIKRVTTYDAGVTATSGLVVTDTSENGFVVNRLSEDAGNNNSWSSIETNFVPGTDTVADRLTTYDNGTTKSETFTDGVLTEVVRTGDPETQSFVSQTTTYNLETGGRTIVTVGTNGQTTTDVYDATNTLVSRTQVDGEGDANSVDWSMVVTTYSTVDGVTTTERVYTYDNGVTRAETLVNGTLTQVVQTDSNIASWSTITDTFAADGSLLTREKVEDDGDTITENYVDGNLQSVVRVDVSEAATTAWQSMTRTYDAAGNLVSEVQLMDDGSTVTKTIGQRDVPGYDADGLPTTKSVDYVTKLVMQDTDTVDPDTGMIGHKAWDSITTNYGTDGIVTSSTTVMDDTDTIERTYAAGGVIAQVVKTDVDDSSSFETVTMDYDAGGTLASVAILRDDDVTIETDYNAAGQRTHAVLTDTTDLASPLTTSPADDMDGAYKWSSIDKVYEDDKLVSQTIVYDDTNEITTLFDDTVTGDVILTTTQSQTGGGVPDGSEFWTDKITTYVAGDSETPMFVESATIVTNLGRTTVIENGTDGIRDSMIVTDTGAGPNGSFDWSSIEMQYDAAGNMVSRQQVADTGDQTLRLYDASGAVTDIVRYDGDDSNTWVFRITTFDESGNAVNQNVNSLAELPLDYLDYFDGVPGLPII